MKLRDLIDARVLYKESQRTVIYNDTRKHDGYLDAMLSNGVIDDLLDYDVYAIHATHDKVLCINIWND